MFFCVYTSDCIQRMFKGRLKTLQNDMRKGP